MVNEDDKLPNVVTDDDVDDGGESLEICVPLDGEETPLPNEG